jgi:hypothetical protein
VTPSGPVAPGATVTLDVSSPSPAPQTTAPPEHGKNGDKGKDKPKG